MCMVVSFEQITNYRIMIKENIWVPFDDYTIFTLYYGSLSINEIEMVSKLQIVWYGCTFIYGVPRDPKHHYFVFLDTKIRIKTLLPMRQYIDKSTGIVTKILIHGISVIGIVYALIYIFAISWRDDEDVGVEFVIIDVALVLLLCIFMMVLIYKYFEWSMLKELVLQFRANMLMASVLILIFAVIQKLLWMKNVNTSFVVEIVLNQSVIVIACILAYIRDGLNIAYPNYFIIAFGIMLGIVAFWNIFLLTFGLRSTQYPNWFILIEKQAFFQIMLIAYLSIYYLWRDRDGLYFR